MFGRFSVAEFHPDVEKLQLFTAADDYKIRVWDLKTSSCVALLVSHYSVITALQFSPDAELLYRWLHSPWHLVANSSRDHGLTSSLGTRSVPWLGRRVPPPCYPVLCCPLPDRVAPVFVQVISPPLGWSPLHLFLYGLQVVTRKVHRSSLTRLICPAQDQFIFLTLLIIAMTFVLCLAYQMTV